VERRGRARNRVGVRWYYGTMRGLLVASLLALGSVGCDKLISSDVAEIGFLLPPRTYSFDSAAFPVPAGVTGPVACGDGTIVMNDCCLGGQVVGCSPTEIACEQNENGMRFCTATVSVSQSQEMNLGMEVDKLSGYTGFVNIKVKRISYEIPSNTLDVDLPDVLLYLGPKGAMTPEDADVKMFGTLPAISAMSTTPGDVVLVSNAAAVLAGFTSDIKAPFTFIAATTLKVTRPPTGKLDLKITGELAISP
jgi:hypothetical protein